MLPASKISESPSAISATAALAMWRFLGVDMGFAVDRLIAVVAAEHHAAVGTDHLAFFFQQGEILADGGAGGGEMLGRASTAVLPCRCRYSRIAACRCWFHRDSRSQELGISSLNNSL